MFKQLKKNKGFTLVEVIVVAVIVAVLALVAIQFYQGYINESRRNTAENLAASAAGFLLAGVNSVGDSTVEAACIPPLKEYETWTLTLSTGNVAYFKAPKDAEISYDATLKTVTAKVKGVQSQGTYNYK